MYGSVQRVTSCGVVASSRCTTSCDRHRGASCLSDGPITRFRRAATLAGEVSTAGAVRALPGAGESLVSRRVARAAQHLQRRRRRRALQGRHRRNDPSRCRRRRAAVVVRHEQSACDALWRCAPQTFVCVWLCMFRCACATEEACACIECLLSVHSGLPCPRFAAFLTPMVRAGLKDGVAVHIAASLVTGVVVSCSVRLHLTAPRSPFSRLFPSQPVIMSSLR
jgi:hypothetical protein